MLVPPLFLVFTDVNKIRLNFVNTNKPRPKKAKLTEKASNI